MEYSYKIFKTDKREKYVFNMSFYTFFELLIVDVSFRETIVNIFMNSQFNFVYWQFPVYSDKTKLFQAQFEFVKSSPFKSANYLQFVDKFTGKKFGEVITFNNISNDTKLISIVPTNLNYINLTCSDIMTFMLKSDKMLKHNILKTIGVEMLKNKNPCYLSTHGKGVEWIHIRMCNKPKHYV